MDRKEAIKDLEILRDVADSWGDTDAIELDMAIEALKAFGCTGCEHYDQEETAMICKDCRRYYEDKHSQYEPHKDGE